MLAILLAFTNAQVAASAPTRFDRDFAIEIESDDHALDGQGPSKRVELTCEFEGVLHLWTTVEGAFDACLRVEGPRSTLLAEDADSGGRPTPYIALDVEEGMALVIAVASQGPITTSARLTLHARAAPESDVTRAAAADAAAEIARLESQPATERGADVEALVGRLLQVEGGRDSDRVNLRLLFAGELADKDGILHLTDRAWRSVLAHYERTLPPDHVYTNATRKNLSGIARRLGNLAESRALAERAVESLERTLPHDDRQVRLAWAQLAMTLGRQGELAAARVLEEKVLDVSDRTLAPDDVARQIARTNLAITLKRLGDLAGARALQEEVLEHFERTRPEGDPDLDDARSNLAMTLWAFGELQAARELEERVVASREQSLPNDHPQLVMARSDLALILHDLGDLAAARAMQQRVLEDHERTLTDDHPELLQARNNLALTLRTLGERAAARALQENVLANRERTLPDDHPDLAIARQNLALTLREAGELAPARELFEQALSVLERRYPASHPSLARVRGNLADTLRELGEIEEARALEQRVVEQLSRALPPDHPNLIRAHRDRVITIATAAARSGHGVPPPTQALRALEPSFVAAVRAHLESLRRCAQSAFVDASPREAEARILARQVDLDRAFSESSGYGIFPPNAELEREVFVLSEALRSAALSAARLARRASNDSSIAALRSEWRRGSEELARIAQSGGGVDEIDRARSRVDALGRELVRRANTAVNGLQALEIDLDAVVAPLPHDAALISWRRYTRHTIESVDPPRWSLQESLCAFVLRKDPNAEPPGEAGEGVRFRRIELGPIEPFVDASERWRRAICSGTDRGVVRADVADVEQRESGSQLRTLVLDPLLRELEGVGHLVLVLDDVLHAIPFDALPLDSDDGARVGDRHRIEVHSSLYDLLATDAKTESRASLVALGHPSFDTDPVDEHASDDRGADSWRRGFATLPETRAEVRAIAQYFEEAFGEEASSTVLERREASRRGLVELAPSARWLHVATHGWYAPESVRSLADSATAGRPTLVPGMGVEERIVGLSPMLLCGLALAGANRPPDAIGRVEGLITAQEVAALDLARCELAVLSACDTNVGVRLRRAGQGVASLQLALHMAGARSAITSLWKVPDEATKDLMIEFYRRLWIEKQPKWKALWEAKLMIRNALDDDGELRYSTRDWAAWVLSGDPD